MKTAKLIFSILAIALCLSVLLTGCANNASQESEKERQEREEQAEKEERKACQKFVLFAPKNQSFSQD